MSWLFNNGLCNLYEIPIDLINKISMNKTESFKEQQEQKRRPRFSIYKEIILTNQISPIRSIDINKW